MTAFTVTTWNVENVFLPKAADGAAKKALFADKVDLIASVLKVLNPDIVAFQELGGGEDLLKRIDDDTGGAYKHRRVSGKPDGRQIRVGFLSKRALTKVKDIFDFPQGPALKIHTMTGTGTVGQQITRMGRGALSVTVTKSGTQVEIVTAHLKSKLLTYPRTGGVSFSPRDETERTQAAGIALMRRMAEAVTLRTYANSVLEGSQDTRLIVLGDFNDVPEAQTSLLLAGPEGSEIGTGSFQKKDKGDDARLFNLAPLIPEDRRYSRVHRDRPELLDQIFVSEEMLPRGADNKRRLPSVDSFVDIGHDLPSIGENPKQRLGELIPDHAPVTATFDL